MTKTRLTKEELKRLCELGDKGYECVKSVRYIIDRTPEDEREYQDLMKRFRIYGAE